MLSQKYKIDEEALTNKFKNMYFSYYDNLSKALNNKDNNKDNNPTQNLEKILEKEFLLRTKAFINLHKNDSNTSPDSTNNSYSFENDTKFKENSLEEKALIFDKTIIKGLNIVRANNGALEDYELKDDHSLGIRFYHHK